MSSMWNRFNQDNFFDTSNYFDTPDDSFDQKLEKLLKQRPELAEFYKDHPRRKTGRSADFPFSNFARPDTFPRRFGSRFSPEDSERGFPASSTSNAEARNFTAQKPVDDVIDDSAPVDNTDILTDIDRPKQGLSQYNLRNTVDLGQKTASFEEFDELDKNKRSMSAPPDARSVPVQTGNQPAASAKRQSEQSNDGRQPVEHIIPIVVEGRDEPLINKIDTAGSFAETRPTAHHQNDADRFHMERDDPFDQRFGDSYASPRNHMRMFPSDMSPRGKFHKHSKYSQESPEQQPVFPQNRQPPKQFKQQQEKENKPTQSSQVDGGQGTKVHNVLNDENTQGAPAQEPYPTQPPPPVINDPIQKIQLIQNDVLALMTQVENFSGKTKRDKEYMYLDEMLTRNLLKLDVIDTEGKENIRLARKEAIRCIQQCIAVLENKAEQAAQERGGSGETMMDQGNSSDAAAQDSEKMDSKPSHDESERSTRMDVDEQSTSPEATAGQNAPKDGEVAI